MHARTWQFDMFFLPSFLAARATWLREFGFLYIQVRRTVGGLDNFDLEAILLQRNSNHSSTHQALTTTSTTGKEINGSLSPITHYDADNLLVWKEFVWGALAGGFGETVMHPIDTVKTRIQCGGHFGVGTQMHGTGQALKSIVAIDGLKGLYRGIGPAMTGSLVSGATYFGCIEGTKEWLFSRRPDLSSPWFSFISGASGDIIASVVYVPCEVMKQRMQVQGSKKTWYAATRQHTATSKALKTPTYQYYSGLFNVGISILKSEGLRGLYAGYFSTLARDVPFAGFQIVFYESLKEAREHGSTAHQCNFLEELVMGGVAGGLSAYLTTPMDVMKTRLQVQGTTVRYKGWMDALRTIWKEEGISGFLQGWAPRVAWVIPASALTFMAYENLRRLQKDGYSSEVQAKPNMPVDRTQAMDVADLPSHPSQQ